MGYYNYMKSCELVMDWNGQLFVEVDGETKPVVIYDKDDEEIGYAYAVSEDD